MTKREVLFAICENPGWHPPAMEDGSHMHTMLTQLNEEGWILPRLDGFEATPKALTEYPAFASQKDIRDLNAPNAVAEPVKRGTGAETTEWVKVVLENTMVLRAAQTVSMPIREEDLDGGITLTKLGNDWKGRIEVQVALRIRELPINDKEGE
jgi:hypothetical protein